MNMSDSDEERPLSWLAVLENTPVFSSDGQELGMVKEMIGSEEEDIFHGVVIGKGLTSADVLIPGEDVTSITNKRVDINLKSEEVRALPPHVEEHSYHLGFVGLFSKRLGWTEEGKHRR